MGGPPAIRTHGLTKRYGRTSALHEVDLEVRPGEIFGFVGPNGAGKTTTLRLLMGLLRPTRGRAEVLGHDTWRDSLAVRRRVGYVSGETALYDRLTGGQHVEYLRHLAGHDRRRADALAGRLELDLSRRAREMSKGNRQKLAIVLGLMGEPELLLLDEPTSGLDPIAQNRFHALLREHTAAGGTVLLSSHVLAEVHEVADRVGILRGGELIAVESLEEVSAKSLHHVRVTFGTSVPAEEFRALGLRDLAMTDDGLTCSAPQGALDGLLKAVARHPVVDFECAEAGLEETFLAYYGGEGAHDAA